MNDTIKMLSPFAVALVRLSTFLLSTIFVWLGEANFFFFLFHDAISAAVERDRTARATPLAPP